MTWEEHYRKAVDDYEYRVDWVLPLSKVGKLRQLLEVHGGEDLSILADSLRLGSYWAHRFCDQVALKESIADGYRGRV